MSWSTEDLGYALAWQAEQDTLCGGCGQPRDESMSPDAEGSYVAKPVRCHACAEQSRAAKVWADSPGERAGLFFSVDRQSR